MEKNFVTETNETNEAELTMKGFTDYLNKQKADSERDALLLDLAATYLGGHNSVKSKYPNFYNLATKK